jgi:hypothetical protein
LEIQIPKINNCLCTYNLNFKIKDMKRHIGFLIGLVPLFASAQLVITNNYYIVLNGGTQANPTSLVLTNPATNAITNSANSWIVSEGEFNQVDWNIGTNTGTFTVPFGYGSTDYLPVTCKISGAGTGSGAIRFSTYHGASWDNSTYEPSDVTNMTDFGATDYSKNAVDRFWILDAQGYTTKPTSDITLTYIRSGASSEIAAPNYMVEADFIAQRFNSSAGQWGDWLGATGMDVTSPNTGAVSSGNIPATDFYRSWSIFNDSNLMTSGTGVNELNTVASKILTYPNPTNSSINISGLTKGQKIDLYDDLGQKLTSMLVDNFTMRIDMATKPNGIYLIRIENSDGSLVTEKKIVKTE